MGKKKYIETPEKMWDLFCAYREDVKKNPRKKMVFVGRDGSQDYELLERPLTYDGFQVFGYENNLTVHHYFDNPDGAYDDYREVCTRIKKQIRDDQITGGMVGQYNSSITQRLNGLVEKTQTEVKMEQPLFGDE